MKRESKFNADSLSRIQPTSSAIWVINYRWHSTWFAISASKPTFNLKDLKLKIVWVFYHYTYSTSSKLCPLKIQGMEKIQAGSKCPIKENKKANGEGTINPVSKSVGMRLSLYFSHFWSSPLNVVLMSIMRLSITDNSSSRNNWSDHPPHSVERNVNVLKQIIALGSLSFEVVVQKRRYTWS